MPFKIVIANSVNHVDSIMKIMQSLDKEPSLFIRSKKDIEQNINEFILAQNERGEIVGCAALHKVNRSNAEILSLAVLPQWQNLKVGKKLIKKCIELSVERNVINLWVSSLRPGIFALFGFRQDSMFRLPLAYLLGKVIALIKQPKNRWMAACFSGFKFLKLKNEYCKDTMDIHK